MRLCPFILHAGANRNQLKALELIYVVVDHRTTSHLALPTNIPPSKRKNTCLPGCTPIISSVCTKAVLSRRSSSSKLLRAARYNESITAFACDCDAVLIGHVIIVSVSESTALF